MQSYLEAYTGAARRSGDEDALRALLELGLQLVDGREGSLLIHDEDAGELEFVFVVGSRAADDKLTGQRVPVGDGVTGMAAFSGETQIGETRYTGVEQPDGRTPGSVIAAPMIIDDRLVGVMTAVRFPPDGAFGPEAITPFSNLARIGAALLRARFQLHDLGALTGSAGTGAVLASPEERALVAAIRHLLSRHPDRTEAVTRLLKAAGDLGHD